MNLSGLLRKTLILLAIMIGLVLGIGFALPDHFHVERTLVINSTPEKVFPFVNDLGNWSRWDPWSQDDPNMQREIVGASGVGQVQKWRSPASGTGVLETMESKKHTALRFKLMTHASSYPRFLSFTLVDLGGKTQLTWSIDGENSMKPIGNYFGLGMNRYLGPMYEQGLSNLKSLVETNKLPPLVEEKKRRNQEKAEALKQGKRPRSTPLGQ